MTHQSNNVFMIGWEYPPNNSGGLGVACEGLTQALSDENTNLHFTLPFDLQNHVSHMKVHSCVHNDWKQSKCTSHQNGKKCFHPHTSPPFFAYSPELVLDNENSMSAENLQNSGYSFDLAKLRKLSSSQLEKQVTQYAEVVADVGTKKDTNFDLIHAHDWMSFPAGQYLKQKTGKPFVAHVHSTEYDRSGLNDGNQYISSIEYQGMHQADRVIAVSYYTKRLLEQKYGVDPHKISVVHNGITDFNISKTYENKFAPKRPVIVFMGRLTIQKGVSYFLDLAHSVLKRIPNALFVVAGSGDMYHELLLKTAKDGLSASVVFSGFVRDEQRNKLFDRADVFVMPSISEPFGLVALEAAQRHTPVIVSKNAGVAEVLPHAIILDFWDLNKMTDSIEQLVKDKSFLSHQVSNQINDLKKQTWKDSAIKIKEVYRKAFLGI